MIGCCVCGGFEGRWSWDGGMDVEVCVEKGVWIRIMSVGMSR
jgi:hypothetical protein